MFANYHTHTYRCQHASGSDREYVEAAIETGLKVLGFSDHCPWVYQDKEFVSKIRMTPAQVDGYFSSLEGLKKEYEKDIRIYIGLECEHCLELIEAQEQMLSGYPLDYRILGQHFLGVEKEVFYTGRRHEEVAFLKEYVDTVIDGIRSGKYLYVAHPDLVHYIGPDDIYRSEMGRLCEELKKADMPAELNLLGLAEGRQYPDRRFLEIAKNVGNPVILGIDAHAPMQIRDREVQQRAEELCKEYGLRIFDEDLLEGRS